MDTIWNHFNESRFNHKMTTSSAESFVDWTTLSQGSQLTGPGSLSVNDALACPYYGLNESRASSQAGLGQGHSSTSSTQDFRERSEVRKRGASSGAEDDEPSTGQAWAGKHQKCVEERENRSRVPLQARVFDPTTGEVKDVYTFLFDEELERYVGSHKG